MDRSKPSLQSARLRLVVPGRRHFLAWTRVREQSRHHLTPYEPQWADDDLTWQGYNRRLRRYRRDRRHATGLSFLIIRLSDGQLVGGITLGNIRRGVTQSASVGYWLGETFLHQGYASEALQCVLDFAFDELGLNRVEAACMPHNQASVGVLERTGFCPEGRARRYLKINGVFEDHLLFARLCTDRPVDRPTRRHTHAPQPASCQHTSQLAHLKTDSSDELQRKTDSVSVNSLATGMFTRLSVLVWGQAT